MPRIRTQPSGPFSNARDGDGVPRSITVSVERHRRAAPRAEHGPGRVDQPAGRADPGHGPAVGGQRAWRSMPFRQARHDSMPLPDPRGGRTRTGSLRRPRSEIPGVVSGATGGIRILRGPSRSHRGRRIGPIASRGSGHRRGRTARPGSRQEVAKIVRGLRGRSRGRCGGQIGWGGRRFGSRRDPRRRALLRHELGGSRRRYRRPPGEVGLLDARSGIARRAPGGQRRALRWAGRGVHGRRIRSSRGAPYKHRSSSGTFVGAQPLREPWRTGLALRRPVGASAPATPRPVRGFRRTTAASGR